MNGAARLPDDEVSGVRAYRLAGQVATEVLRPLVGTPAPGGDVQAEAWIEQKGYRVLRLRLRGRILEGDSPDVSRTVDLSNFDRPLAIEPPK